MAQQKVSEQISQIPEIFISYSWTNEVYTQWVLELAEELMANGISVHLDQWHLKDGDDKYVYMERMVTDPKIQKVIILCDKQYQEKADDRKGGVGTESTIIAPQIYEDVKVKTGQQKFIPVITKRYDNAGNEDVEGLEYVPAFLKGRKYIDFSNENHRAESMEQLIRTIYNKPRLAPPLIGKTPSYISEDSKTNLGTASRQRRAADLIRNEKPQALGAVKDYLSTLSENFEEFDLTETELTTDIIIERMKEMTPVRDELIELVEIIARYSSDTAVYSALHDFFESLIPYLDPAKKMGQYHTWQADHYKFIIREMFLYTVASLLRHHRFSEINELTEQGYYISDGRLSGGNTGLQTFKIFDTYCESLRHYNSRQQRRALEVEASFVKERATRKDVRFIDLIQADFFLYVLDQLQPSSARTYKHHWYPETLAYAEGRHQPFEVFMRAESKRFFERLRLALGGVTKEELERLSEEFDTGSRKTLKFNFFEPNPAFFMGISHIATRP